MDTEAAVSLVNSNVYWSLSNPAKLSKPKVNLKSVNGFSLCLESCNTIEFKIEGLTMSHPFYVVRNINQSFIICRNWLVQIGVRLYFDLGSLRIEKTYVPMVEDIHIASILHNIKKTVLKPNQQQFVLQNINIMQIFNIELLKSTQ